MFVKALTRLLEIDNLLIKSKNQELCENELACTYWCAFLALILLNLGKNIKLFLKKVACRYYVEQLFYSFYKMQITKRNRYLI